MLFITTCTHDWNFSYTVINRGIGIGKPAFVYNGHLLNIRIRKLFIYFLFYHKING